MPLPLPRFRLRTLLILLTLVAAYLACWGPTKDRAAADVEERLGEFVGAEPVAPLLVTTRESRNGLPFQRYCFWFFGFVWHSKDVPKSEWDGIIEIIQNFKAEQTQPDDWPTTLQLGHGSGQVVKDQ